MTGSDTWKSVFILYQKRRNGGGGGTVGHWSGSGGLLLHDGAKSGQMGRPTFSDSGGLAVARTTCWSPSPLRSSLGFRYAHQGQRAHLGIRVGGDVRLGEFPFKDSHRCPADILAASIHRIDRLEIGAPDDPAERQRVVEQPLEEEGIEGERIVVRLQVAPVN